MSIFTDLRGAWRSLSNSPGFLALAGFVLALGLGTTIFMFGVLNTLLFRPPPFPNAERIDRIILSLPTDPNDNEIDYEDYYTVREAQRSYDTVGAIYNGTVILSGEGLPERLEGAFASSTMLQVFGAQAALGRLFSVEDDRAAAAPVTVLSYDLWQSRFAGDRAILGRVLRLNGKPSTVIGVLPKDFEFGGEDLWLPIARDRGVVRRADPEAIDVAVFGLRKTQLSRTQAQADVQIIAAQIEAREPQSAKGLSATVLSFAEAALGRDGTQLMLILFGAVWLVLLVACATVASLIFVRANHRVYEAAMRAALGAKRLRLVAQMLAESVVIAAIGLLGGLALAAIALYIMHGVVHNSLDDPPRWWSFDIDWRVAVFAAVAALIAAVLAGLVPALRASRPNVMAVLRDGGRSGTGLRLSRFTTTMVIIELAVSAALLTGAGLMMRTALTNLSRDYGADVKPFMSGRIGLPLANYPEQRRVDFFTRYLDELRAIPGVHAAVAATAMPGIGVSKAAFAVDGAHYRDVNDYAEAQDITVAPGFFAGLQRTMLAGRDFGSGDNLSSTPSVIVNDALVQRYFNGRNPLGRRIKLNPSLADGKWVTIVGVAPNIQHDNGWDQGGGFPPVMYRSMTQFPERFMTVAVRVDGDPHEFTNPMRARLKAVDADLALYFIGTVPERQALNGRGLRIISGMFTSFAVVSMLLAAVGIYGVLAFTAGRRTRELGIRRALGAHDRQILRTVTRSALWQLLIGLGLGAVLAPLMGRLLGEVLSGMSPDDPIVYAGVFTLLVVATLIASWMPALRALRVQPATALRHE